MLLFDPEWSRNYTYTHTHIKRTLTRGGDIKNNNNDDDEDKNAVQDSEVFSVLPFSTQDNVFSPLYVIMHCDSRIDRRLTAQLSLADVLEFLGGWDGFFLFHFLPTGSKNSFQNQF